MISGIMYCDISDHLSIFVIAPINRSKSGKNINDTEFINDISNLLLKIFRCSKRRYGGSWCKGDGC